MHEFPPVTSLPIIFTVTELHASLAVGAVNEGEEVHSIVAFAPAVPIVGDCVSTCVIIWATVLLEFPQASIALQVLVVVFTHEVPPVTSEPTCITVAVLQASDAVGAVNDGVAVHSIVAFVPGVPIVGACESVCVIVWLTVPLEFPQASVALHVLVVVFAHEVPPVTSLPTCTTVTVLHASEAVGAVNDGVAVHSIVVFAPALPMVGACVSTCVMV